MHDVADQCNRPGPDNYANGYKPKTVLTRLGELTFQVPQVRCGDFYPSALEKGTRTDQAVHLALAEMYVQGVSTRRVIEVLQRLLGPRTVQTRCPFHGKNIRRRRSLTTARACPYGAIISGIKIWSPDCQSSRISSRSAASKVSRMDKETNAQLQNATGRPRESS